MSTTRTINIREFRTNIARHLKDAQENNVHFVVMRHAKPIAHVTPIHAEDSSLESLAAKVARARKDIEEGRVYSSEEVLAMIDRRAAQVHRRSRGRPRKTSTKRRT